jgi:hypothetical protein
MKKCIFFSPFGVLLGHIVCKQGLLVDPSKIAIIVDLSPPSARTYWLLQEIHQRICTDYNTYGEAAEERLSV